MKKLLLFCIYFLFTAAMVNSQITEIQFSEPVSLSGPEISAMTTDTATQNTERIRLDSNNVEDFNAGAWSVLNILNGYAQFIPGVPNIILQTITGVIIGLIVRRREKKALRKKGVLLDKAETDKKY